MPQPPVTVLDPVIEAELKDFNDVRALALAMTAAQAIIINEAPGLVSDPVLGPGTPSLTALNLDWQFFFKGNFETTGHQKILMVQQALDTNRAKELVRRARLFVNVQDPVYFGINQVA